ncbi:RNA polymerase II holoenzyme cyclin-like subunit [Sporothrix epigloea]|uniref:RNA polymerase II holoenzyme cyclin-like subunit n=1 Tax=Sporothrix epigloea TaxID=1892477 RepID=A0ABP0DJ85_9PEZI
MAASYWDSTQRRYWEFSKEQLAALRQHRQDEERSLVQMYPLPEWRHLSIFFSQQLMRLAKRMQVRQQALATAQVFLKRFFCKVEIRRTNPYLVMATALYLACKTEECSQHIRLVVQEAKALWPDTHCLEIARVGETEFWMISELSSQLIIHAPYRTLQMLQAELNLMPDELTQAWAFINDHYMTDLPLLYPPHVIAVTAFVWVLVLQPTMQGGANSNGASIGHMGQAMMGAAAAGGKAHGNLNSSQGSGALTMGAIPSSLAQPPLLLSLSSLGPGSSTPGGTPGTPVIAGLGTPTTLGGGIPNFSVRSAMALHAQAQAQAQAAQSTANMAGAAQMQHMQQGGSAAPGTYKNAPGNKVAGGGNNNASSEEAPPPHPPPPPPPPENSRTATMQWLIRWLAESGFDMEATIDCTQEMISFYMASEEYNEKLTREQINRFIKARGLDR